MNLKLDDTAALSYNYSALTICQNVSNVILQTNVHCPVPFYQQAQDEAYWRLPNILNYIS